MNILALETSCDETSAAIVRSVAARGGFKILANIVSSQIALHQPYGGVVPEIASRQHLALLQPVIQQALAEARISLKKIDAVAATYGPGLASSLLIGLTAAKAIAVAIRKPFIAVNHLEGHLRSPFLRSHAPTLPRSHVSLIVSGGHTVLLYVNARGKPKLLGQTFDDAAGEAFDKVAKLLGLGYPGGPVIDRLAREGNPAAIRFPRSLLDRDDSNFSFSGLKTAVLYFVKKAKGQRSKVKVEDVCASFQEAVVDVLVGKTLRAAKKTGVNLITVGGGVAGNSRLREKFQQALRHSDTQALFAQPEFCTDNAAMIAAAAFAKLKRPSKQDLFRDAEPSAKLV